MNSLSTLRLALVSCALIFSAYTSHAQRDSLSAILDKLQDEEVQNHTKPGTVKFHTPHVIDSLERTLRGKTELRGYRIQIFLGGAAEAKASRQKFLGLGLGLTCYMVQNVPSYAVRVGDFRNALEANRYLATVKSHYPGAFVLQDEIEPPKFAPRPAGEK